MFAVCLYGPTGVGKTAIALEVASRFDVEIVSVDSAMVYRGMDIGTAKPSPAERSVAPHHLIDIRDPWESYSAGAFREDALRAIEDITRRGRVPLLVGGTMLYLRALWRGLAELPQADEAVRAAIDREAAERGWPAMHADLALADPEAAVRIRPGDRQRIQRALEVYRLTGTPLTAWQARVPAAAPVRFLRIALLPSDRSLLYRRLDERFLAMVLAGFPGEVERLRSLPGMPADAPSMRAVGYRQLWSCLAGEYGMDEAVRRAQLATRHLAKRQLTWIRAEPSDVMLPVAEGLPSGVLDEHLAAVGVSRRD